MPKNSITVTIPAGQSLSNSADLTTGSVNMIIAPTDWSPANISFQASADNTTFADLYDITGTQIIRAMRPGSAVLIDHILTDPVAYLKIRSGPAENPVPQASDRVITLVLI